MLKVEAYVDQSGIHGLGLFAARKIPKGTIVWHYEPPDRRVPFRTATLQMKHFGYVNPMNPDWLVICGDHSEWWNFASDANCDVAFPPEKDREADIIAVRDIAEGTEMTISLASDHDAYRKMS